MGKRAMVIASAVAASVMVAAPATAASPRQYVSGAYAGKVSQAIPQSYTGSIGFSIHAGVLSALHFKVSMVCGKLLMAEVTSPPRALRIRVHRDGTFSYTRTLAGTLIRLSGSVHGKRARGTFFESFHTTPSYQCTMYAPAPFGAGWGSSSGSGGSTGGGSGSGSSSGSSTQPGVATVTGATGVVTGTVTTLTH